MWSFVGELTTWSKSNCQDKFFCKTGITGYIIKMFTTQCHITTKQVVCCQISVYFHTLRLTKRLQILKYINLLIERYIFKMVNAMIAQFCNHNTNTVIFAIENDNYKYLTTEQVLKLCIEHKCITEKWNEQ